MSIFVRAMAIGMVLLACGCMTAPDGADDTGLTVIDPGTVTVAVDTALCSYLKFQMIQELAADEPDLERIATLQAMQEPCRVAPPEAADPGVKTEV